MSKTLGVLAVSVIRGISVIKMCSDRVSCCVALERLDFAAALVSFTSAVFAEVIGFPSACPSRIGRCVALSILFPAAVRQGSSEHRELTGFAIGDIPLNEMRVCVCVCVKSVLVSNAKRSMQAQRAGGSPGATQAACSRAGQ